MRVAAEAELFGIIWATDTARALSESDYGTIRQAADVAGAIFVRQQLSMRRESMLRAELVDEVVSGRISDPENIRTIGLSVGWNVERLQQALVVSIDDFEAFRLQHSKRGARLHRTQEKLIELVRLDVLAIDPGALIGMRSSSVIVLLDAHEESTAGRKAVAVRLADSIVKRVAAYLPEMHVTVGIGRDFPSLEHMAESFRQAELAAELGSVDVGRQPGSPLRRPRHSPRVVLAPGARGHDHAGSATHHRVRRGSRHRICGDSVGISAEHGAVSDPRPRSSTSTAIRWSTGWPGSPRSPALRWTIPTAGWHWSSGFGVLSLDGSL